MAINAKTTALELAALVSQALKVCYSTLVYLEDSGKYGVP